MYSNKENVNILTAMLAAYGIRHIVVCPGSRNAPLVHNFNEHPNIICHPITDERSAAFVALGISLRSRTTVAVCVTSGSALLNTLPGIAEASYQNNGIIVISADRPNAWIDQLDGQTIPQPDALGKFVARSVSLPEPHDDEERWFCRRLIQEAMLSLAKEKKSVHINVPISEPLFEFATKKLNKETPLRILEDTDDLLSLLSKEKARRPMIVIGQSRRYAIEDDVLSTISYPIAVLSEQLSSDNPSPSLDTVFEIMGEKQKDYQPDFLIYIGGHTISKRLRHFLRSLKKTTIVLCNETGELHDPTMHASYILQGDPRRILGEFSVYVNRRQTPFSKKWEELFEKAKAFINEQPLSLGEQAVKAFEQQMTKDDNVFYANSSAIRMATRHADHFVFCNRGINGIEGSLSTATGFSIAEPEENVYCVIGDLSFFYDQNALWNVALRGNFRIILLNNGGGEIFKKLLGLELSPARDEYVMASHNTTAEGICKQNNISYRCIRCTDAITSAINWLTKKKSENNRPMLLEINEL